MKTKTFWNNVLKLFSGLLLAQLIHIGFSFVLPRIYDPDDFASFGIFLATTLIFFEINNFKLDYALMLPELEEERIGLYKKAIYYSTVFSGILAGVFLLYILLPQENPLYYLGWIPVSVFLNGLIQPTMTYCNRHNMYQLMNVSRIIQSLVTGVVSCVPVLVWSSKIFLIEGFVMGQVASFLVMMPLFLRLYDSPSIMNKELLLRFVHFPKYGTWSSLLNTFSRNAIFYVMGYFFSPSQTGAFTFTHRLVNAPLGLITGATGQAYFRESSIIKDKKSLQQLTFKILSLLALSSVIPVALAIFEGPAIFSFLFGTEWSLAGEVARYLALWYGVSLVVTPLSMLLDVKGYLRWELGYNVAFFIIRILFLLIGGIWLGFENTLILYCGIGLVFNLYLLYFILKISRDEI